MKISAIHIANLFDYGSYLGTNELQLRQYLDDEELDINNPENNVSDKEFLSVFETLSQKVKHTYFGLYYGCYLNIKSLGFIAEISLNASSIEQAIFILQQYLSTSFSIVELTTKEYDNSFEIRLDSPIKNEILKSHLLDTVFCFIYRELKLMVSDSVLPALKLPYNDTSEYSSFLNTKVEYEDAYLIQFNKSILTTEINTKRAKEIEYLLPKFVQMLSLQNAENKVFSVMVRNMILNMCCPEPPNFEQVSKQFPISDRTFQRKLSDEGLSFRRIIDDIRKELSIYLVKGNLIKTKGIAYILGYSEPSAYLHAAKRWVNQV
ncbi:AraC family transcriptional regulator [Flavobacteriaceae bacterium 3-367]|uniref:AraC family transcriptional regulator ligand-binding domain-containing protein n=1 Tax=Eudoraea algarum TaxID=3417568 RepID=UPI0032845D34